MAIMEKKQLCSEIPAPLKSTLDALSRQSGRNINLLVGASLHFLLEMKPDQQEELIRKYLNAFSK